MKIVWCDNFDREYISERVVAENIANDHEANIMLKALRATCSMHDANWYKLVADDYKVRRLEP